MPTPQREASTTMTLRHLLICAACATFMPLAHASNSAEMCISSNSTQNGVAVHNGCDTNVFILWCGELKYSDKRCGDGSNGRYFTHSDNIKPGGTKHIDTKGSVKVVGCKGRIGFGPDGPFEDVGGGQIICK